MGTIGIRREDRSVWERRTPLVPEDVARLVRDERVRLTVQPSPTRIFPDDAFRDAGATVSEDLSGCALILGIKEVPHAAIQARKTYMFFSHTIKGQPHNMPMLRVLLERECTLFDHELVTDDRGRRLIAFGRYAGLAGAIDSLWILGRRLAHEGVDSPFAQLKQSVAYTDLDEARDAVRRAGARIRADGLPAELRPCVIGLTGRGNVGGGAREILELLPFVEIRPDDLPRAGSLADPQGRNLVVVHWKTEELVEPIAPGTLYDRAEYRAQPERYRAKLAGALPHLTLLLHGINWTVGSPRLVTRDDLRRLGEGGAARLRVIGDITCDVGGSLESTVRATDPGAPAYVYDPETGLARDGFEGRGVVVVPVDIFPAEFPKDASHHFSSALAPLVGPLARMDPALGPDDPSLPAALRRSAIAARGKLLPEWEPKLREALRRYGSGANGSGAGGSRAAVRGGARDEGVAG